MSAKTSSLAAEATSTVSTGGARFDMAEPLGASCSALGMIIEPLQFASFTPGVRKGKTELKPFSLPRFEPVSSESSPDSGLDARVKLRIALLQLEMQERRTREEREFQRELKKLEADTAVRMRELELRKATVFSPVGGAVFLGFNCHL